MSKLSFMMMKKLVHFYHLKIGLGSLLTLVLLLMVGWQIACQAQQPSQTLENAPLPNTVIHSALSLSEALKLAEENNMQLQEARKNMALSQLDVIIARRIPNPQLMGNFSVGKVVTVQSNPQQLALTQMIETAGKRRKRTEVAKSQLALTQLEYDTLRWEVRSQVRKAYAQLIASEQAIDGLEILSQLLDRLVGIAKKRYEAGAAPQFEVVQSELVRNQLDSQRNQAQSQIEQARYQVNSLLGNQLPDTFQTTEKGVLRVRVEKTELAPAPTDHLPSKDELYRKALTARADLKSAEQQRVVSTRQLRLTQAQRVPDIELQLGWLTAPAPPHDSRTIWFNGPFIQFNVDLPILHNQGAEIQKGKINLYQNEVQIRDLQRQVRLEIDTAYSRLLAARKNLSLFQDTLIPMARTAMQMAQRSYEVGKTPLVNVIFAQQNVQQVLNSYRDTVVDYQNAWVGLETAVGLPVENW